MPFTVAQLAAGSAAQLDYYLANSPIDQVNKARPLLAMLIEKKVDRLGGNQNVVEQVRKSNDSNYQNYFGDDQVSYNKKDTLAQVKYPWFDAHDGFSMNEDEAAANGIILTDDGSSVPSDAEKLQLTNILEERQDTLKEGFQEAMDLEFHRDGSQSAKAVPGLDSLISTTPAVGVVGTLDPATATYWRNNINLNISTGTAGNLIAQMEVTWRACTLYGGGMAPDVIMASGAFIDAYAADVRKQSGQTIFQNGPSTGGVKLDGSRSGVFFKGKEIMWDPTMDVLDGLFGAPTIPWAKRCYFINSKTVKLRPVKGHWMLRRSPPRVYDRYAYYWAVTAKYSLTTNRRNANAVLSIA